MGLLRDALPLTCAGHLLSRGVEESQHHVASFMSTYNSKDIHVLAPRPVATSLKSAIGYIAEGVDGDFPDRLLLLHTRSGHTLIWNNAWRSFGWNEMTFVLTGKYPVEDVFYNSQESTLSRSKGKLRGQCGAYQFTHLQGGKITRSISLVNDGSRGWCFSTTGEPWPFEDVKPYQAANKRDRFTHDMLVRYLGKMNMFPFEEDYMIVDAQHPAIGIELDVSDVWRERQFPRVSLETILQKYGPFER